MGGGFLTPIVALLALILSGLAALKPSPADVCISWRCILEDWLPVAAVLLTGMGVLLLFAVLATASGRGPQWLHDWVEKMMVPPDTKPSAEMSLEEVVQYAAPRAVTSANSPLDKEVQESVVDLFIRLQGLAALEKLTVFGRFAGRNAGVRDSALSTIPADFWRSAKINYYSYLEDPNVVIEKDGRSGTYDQLHFDRKQVLRKISRGY